MTQPTLPSTLRQYTQGKAAELCSEEALFHIQANGDWLYQQTPLPAKFAKMFCSILNCIEGEYFLITPVEKVRVTVEAYPLVIVDYHIDDTDSASPSSQISTMDTSIGYPFKLANKDSIIVKDDGIFVSLDRGLIGLLGRACYYRYINEFLSFD